MAQEPDAKPVSQQKDENGQFETLKEWVTADIEFSNDWRAVAKEEFGFTAGRQLSKEDEAKLISENRPPVVFNKTLKYIKAVGGIEVNNRQRTTYLPQDPTEPGEVKANEIASQGSDWMDAQCGAPRKKSRAFRDLMICGMGWGESLMDWDEDPKGKYILSRPSPLEMIWDRNAREDNIADSKRRGRVRKMLLSEAKDLMAGLGIDPDEFTDADYDADWAQQVSAPTKEGKTKEQKEKREGNSTAYNDRTEVHIVQLQWWEYEQYMRTVNPAVAKDPNAPRTVDVSVEEFKKANKNAGGKLPGARLRRKVFKQAFLGGKILMIGPGPRPDGFTLHCMTGEPDDNEGTWFGLVRLMRDPATWSNKFFSQLMHIINSTAKGGILFETDAVKDSREFLSSYAKPQAATEVAIGAISKGKIMAKPGVGITAGVAQLLQITDNAFQDTTGINLEIMGLADREQAGVLEAQRKQAAMTILATLFDALTAWEEDRGRTKLYFIQKYLAGDDPKTSRLIRIHGDDGYQAIPLLKSDVFGKFDCIVDDAPTSTNMKEKAWQGLQLLLPSLERANLLTAKVAGMLLDYVPYLPSKLVEALKGLAMAPPDPMAQQHQQIMLEGEEAKVQKDRTSAVLNLANAAVAQAKAATERVAAIGAKVDTVLSIFSHGKPKNTGATNDDQDIIGPTGGVPQLPILADLAAAAPDAAPPAQPGLLPPSGLNGGM